MQDLQLETEAVNRIPIINSLLEIICRTTGMGFAAVARVTEDRWVACSVRDEISFGLKPGGELKIETTICNEIRESHEAVVIDHVEKDKVYCFHPTPALYGFQSYISMPIFKRDGSFFGTLCSIDKLPARISNLETIGMFRMFADLISFHIEAAEKLEFSETKLLQEQKNAELREQFIAILAHDLRNPVAAISNSAELLQMMSEEKDILRIASLVKNSSYRMSSLIDNVLDFASGRLGGGIVLKYLDNIPLNDTLAEVINEARAIWPLQNILAETIFNEPVIADNNRIAQLFSNLLRNAATYGNPEKPIRVQALSEKGRFILCVTNEGKHIPAAQMEKLFQPFFRGNIIKGQQGLGLGLYIASEIAKAHKGAIEVMSTAEKTSFTLTIPNINT